MHDQERIWDNKWEGHGNRDGIRDGKWAEMGHDTIRETSFFNGKREMKENTGKKQYKKHCFQRETGKHT